MCLKSILLYYIEFYGSASSTTFMVATSVTVSTNMATISSQSTTERVYRSTSSANNLINATTTTAIIPTRRSVSTSDNLGIVIVTTSTNVNSTLVSSPMATFSTFTLVSSPMATFSTSQTNKSTSVVVLAVIATFVIVILVTCAVTVAVVGAVIYHKKRKTKYSNQSDAHSNATYGVTMQRFSSNASEPVNGDPNEQNKDNHQYVNISAKKEDSASCHVYSAPHGHIKLQPNPSYGYLSGTTELLEKRDYYI